MRKDDLIYTERVTGVPANWLKPSLRQAGLDPDALPVPAAPRRYEHLPPGARPWRTLWSAGQGLDLINDVPSVAELVQRLRKEYVVACRTADMAAEACRDGSMSPGSPVPAVEAAIEERAG